MSEVEAPPAEVTADAPAEIVAEAEPEKVNF